jgi:hypothetical protein
MAAGAPTSVSVEFEVLPGAWTTTTTVDVIGDSLEIKVGRERGGDAQPGTLRFDLDNSTGAYTPDNPLSTLYPHLKEGIRVAVTVSKSGVGSSNRFVGWVTVLEPELGESPNQSVTHVEAADGLGLLARTTCRAMVRAWCMTSTTCDRFWPLSDESANGGFVEAKYAGQRLSVWNVTAGTGSVDFANDSSFGAGDVPFVKMTSGKGLRTTSPAFSIGSGAFAMCVVHRPNDNTVAEVIALAASTSTTSDAVSITYAVGEGYRATGYNGSNYLSAPVYAEPNQWHYLYLYDNGDGVLRLIVDDATSPTTVTFTGGHAELQHVRIGGAVTQSIGNLALNVDSSTAPYPAELVFGSADDANIGDYLTRATGLNDTVLSIAMDPASGFDPGFGLFPSNGMNGLELVLRQARGHGGVMYHDYDAYGLGLFQEILIRRRDAERLSAVALTLDAEGDLDGPPILIRELGRRASMATVTTGTGEVTVFGDSGLDVMTGAEVKIDTALRDYEHMYAVGSDALARSRDQKLRIASVTFDLTTAETNLYADWFAARVGSRVRVENLPSDHLGVTYIDGNIAGWTERPMLDGYPVTLDLEAADAPAAATWDESRYGWGDGICTASALTSSGTSVTLTWTGGDAMSTDAGDYPMDIDINGERCTISSAPAGASSPQTVTIVRGVAPTVARAHSAGEAVEVWDVARWTF